MNEIQKIYLEECPICGNEEFVEDANFCHICGHRIETETTTIKKTNQEELTCTN